MRAKIKTTVAAVSLAAAVTALFASGPAQAVNPMSGLQGVGTGNFTASTSSRVLNFEVRVPRTTGSRSTIIDVKSRTTGTTWALEGLLACTNNQGSNGSRTGGPSLTDDLVVTCPWPSYPTGLQFGAMITN